MFHKLTLRSNYSVGFGEMLKTTKLSGMKMYLNSKINLFRIRPQAASKTLQSNQKLI